MSFDFCLHPDVVIPLPLRSIGRQAFPRRVTAPGCYPLSAPPALVEHHNNRAGSIGGTRRSSQAQCHEIAHFTHQLRPSISRERKRKTASAGCSGSSWVGRLGACRSVTHVPGQASGRIAQPSTLPGSWLTRGNRAVLRPFFASGRREAGRTRRHWHFATPKRNTRSSTTQIPLDYKTSSRSISIFLLDPPGFAFLKLTFNSLILSFQIPAHSIISAPRNL